MQISMNQIDSYFKDSNEAISIATEVLAMRPDSYEAFYVRAKARRDVG